MGVRNFLIDGISGAGKTTVAEELERRGYDVVHGDRVLAYTGDPLTGEALSGPPVGVADPIAWGYAHWIWPVDRVMSLLADHSQPVTFFCGGSQNSDRFVDQFDAVFVLDVDSDTLRHRLDERGEDEFGGRQPEQEFVLRLHAGAHRMVAAGIAVDATAPPAAIVDNILKRIGIMPAGPR